MIQAGGWKEVPSADVPQDVLLAAARTMEIVANDLEIGRVRLRLFQHDPAVTWNPGSPDIPFQILNAPPFDPEMRGKMVHSTLKCAGRWSTLPFVNMIVP